MIVPYEKRQFPWGQCIFPMEMHKFPKETYVPKLFAIIIISYLFLCRLVTSQWKGFKDSYNFVVGSYTFAHWGNLCLGEQFLRGATMFPQEANVFQTLCEHNFFI